jgi:hypothetical protein
MTIITDVATGIISPSDIITNFDGKTRHNTYPSYQYNETNVMHFSFNLLRITGLYMFGTLLAHPQEVLHKPHLVYCVGIMSVTYLPIFLNRGTAN